MVYWKGSGSVARASPTG
ncbi:hypothetical protein LEMLEM_LOCUS26734 [Lemmus lemmus]